MTDAMKPYAIIPADHEFLANIEEPAFWEQFKDCRAYVAPPDPYQHRHTIRLKSEHGDIVIMEGVHTRDLADFIVEMINARLALTTPA